MKGFEWAPTYLPASRPRAPLCIRPPHFSTRYLEKRVWLQLWYDIKPSPNPQPGGREVAIGPLQLAIHMVQNPLCWRAKIALGKDKQRTYVICFFCLVPVRLFFSSKAGFVLREWLAAKGLFVRPVTQNLSVQHDWTHLGPRTKVPTGIASRIIKSHKPP